MGIVILGANLLFGLRGLDIGSRQPDRYRRTHALQPGARAGNRAQRMVGWMGPPGERSFWPLNALDPATRRSVDSPGLASGRDSGWSDGLYFASLIVGPLLHLALGVAVAWTARPLVGVSGSYLAGMGVAAQSGILSYAVPGRPDHHILIVVLAVVVSRFGHPPIGRIGHRQWRWLVGLAARRGCGFRRSFSSRSQSSLSSWAGGRSVRTTSLASASGLHRRRRCAGNRASSQ